MLKKCIVQVFFFIAGKEMFACSLAISSFRAILETLGGPNEKERARWQMHVNMFINLTQRL